MNDDTFRDTLYTIDKKGKRKWIYPQLSRGFYFYRRQAVAFFLIALYLALPWITINGKQAVLFDIAHREFTFFGTTFWATDTIFLALFLAALAIALFFFTSLFGRVWCGWACPETVFLEFVFRPIERMIEGGPVERARLDQSPWNFEKIRKKLLKHALCAGLAWIIASTVLAYFIGREPLLRIMTDWPMANPGPFFMTLVLMTVMAFQFGWFREQFCTVLCPYARFQSVLMDSHSIAVGYDVTRGEPRGKRSRNKDSEKELGDCIDCGLCVRVCPTGIDIRNGLQLECIHCTQCIDACDSIMEKIGRPKGLIRYATEATLLGQSSPKLSKRTVLYGAILFGILAAFVYNLANRQLSEVKLVRGAPDSIYTIEKGGFIQNNIMARISNKGTGTRLYSVEPIDTDIELTIPVSPFPVGGNALSTLPLFIRVPEETLVDGRRVVSLKISDDDGFEKTLTYTVLGPNR